MINPPAIGAIKGPEKTAMENTAIAEPLVSCVNMSAKTAPTTAKGHDAKNPPQNRHIKTVWISFATATAIWNIEKPKIPISSGKRRPLSSENGAQTKGPLAKPRT